MSFTRRNVAIRSSSSAAVPAVASASPPPPPPAAAAQQAGEERDAASASDQSAPPAPSPTSVAATDRPAPSAASTQHPAASAATPPSARGTAAATASSGSIVAATSTPSSASPGRRPPGTRPSPIDGRLTTSTGCLSFDGLLAGHAGLALGTSVLIEESGTTDYASTLLRYFAAEGVVHGHAVHVVGFPEAWGRELPAPIGPARSGDSNEATSGQQPTERMKIAWRYERLGEFGGGNTSRLPFQIFIKFQAVVQALHIHTLADECSQLTARSSNANDQAQDAFCHAFDLTKRLTFSSPNAINFIPLATSSANPFAQVQASLLSALKSSAPETIHRIVIPSLLSPAIYPLNLSNPSLLLPFLHSLRALLRAYSTRAALMFSVPVTLYPRMTGLTRCIEQLADGVIELVPFPHQFDNDLSGSSLATSGAATAREEKPQGMLHVHRLPVFHERGGGGTAAAGVDDDLAFTVTRRRFAIKPFSLPPLEGDTEAQKAAAEEVAVASTGQPRKLPRKEDLEF